MIFDSRSLRKIHFALKNKQVQESQSMDLFLKEQIRANQNVVRNRELSRRQERESVTHFSAYSACMHLWLGFAHATQIAKKIS